MADAVKILIPLDGSKLAEHSLAYVAALKPLGEEHVELVLAIDEPEPQARRAEQSERERNVAAGYLEEVAGEVREHVGVEVESKILGRPAADAIVNEADAYGADFIVISTHGASGITRWRLGSVADKVIRGTTRNTLVIGPRAAERDQWLLGELLPAFRALMVPLDGSELAEQALPIAQRFAEAFGADLHLVQVVPLTAMGTDAAWAGAYSAEILNDITKEAEEYLKGVAARIPSTISTRLNVQLGSPADSLSSYVSEQSIDLVVMTGHGRGGIARAALGSITDRLLGRAAPVLIVR